MSDDLTVCMRLDLGQRGGTVFGQLGVEGAPARAFTGWIGLNAAIDEALCTHTDTASESASVSSGGDRRAGAEMPIVPSHPGSEPTESATECRTTLVIDGKRFSLALGETYGIPRGAVHTFMSEQGDAAFLMVPTPGVSGPGYSHELKALVDAATDGSLDPRAVMAVMLGHRLTPAPDD